MAKRTHRPAGANGGSNDPSTPAPPRASGARAISQLAAPSTRAAREQLIQMAAYHLYEVRRCEPGHDVEDWLAAEAEVGLPAAT